ncbi:universal stress protein [bacterium]|mgnify:CR=1 FL=1|nr:universal stress protein [bacterium]
MKALEKIALYVDASEEGQRAIHAAIRLSTLSGATIVAVAVINRTVVTQLSRASGKSIAEIEVELEENAWHYLYAAEQEAKDANARIVVTLENGFPEEVLPRLMNEYNVDMLVLGMSERVRQEPARRRLLEQMIEHAPCCVLVVK